MNYKHVYAVHGWDGGVDKDWFPWLKSELDKKVETINIIEMPNPSVPKINEWIKKLKEEIIYNDENTILVGHSIGCQAILRYIETLPVSDTKIGKVILVAPWMELDEETIKEEGEGVREIALPWMETPIDFEKIKSRVEKVVAIFSDNDPYVPLNQEKFFKEKLEAEIIIEHNKGHMSEGDGVTELPSIIKSVF